MMALGLLALCVVIHAAAITMLVRRAHKLEDARKAGFVRSARILVGVASWIVLAHLLEIGLWAAAYVAIGALPDFDDALYFSEITYTTVGYGDVLLSREWHLLSGIEGLTGILMAGWSTAFLFVVLSRLVGQDEGARPGDGSNHGQEEKGSATEM